MAYIGVVDGQNGLSSLYARLLLYVVFFLSPSVDTEINFIRSPPTARWDLFHSFASDAGIDGLSSRFFMSSLLIGSAAN